MNEQRRVAGPGASGEAEGEGGPLGLLVEVTDADGAAGARRLECGVALDDQLGRVEARCRWTGSWTDDVDLDRAGEGGRLEVGGERQAVGIGSTVRGRR